MMRLFSAIFTAALFACAAEAHATRVNFAFELGKVPQAIGDFTYPTGETGVLGFGQLTAFNLDLFGDIYDLAEVAGLTAYSWFAYDTVTGTFETNPASCGPVGCYAESLGATNDTLTDGFFFTTITSTGGQFEDYSTFQTGTFDHIAFGVPEPGGWALSSAGLALLGAALRRRRETTPLGLRPSLGGSA